MTGNLPCIWSCVRSHPERRIFRLPLPGVEPVVSLRGWKGWSRAFDVGGAPLQKASRMLYALPLARRGGSALPPAADGYARAREKTGVCLATPSRRRISRDHQAELPRLRRGDRGEGGRDREGTRRVGEDPGGADRRVLRPDPQAEDGAPGWDALIRTLPPGHSGMRAAWPPELR